MPEEVWPCLKRRRAQSRWAWRKWPLRTERDQSASRPRRWLFKVVFFSLSNQALLLLSRTKKIKNKILTNYLTTCRFVDASFLLTPVYRWLKFSPQLAKIQPFDEITPTAVIRDHDTPYSLFLGFRLDASFDPMVKELWIWIQGLAFDL